MWQVFQKLWQIFQIFCEKSLKYYVTCGKYFTYYVTCEIFSRMIYVTIDILWDNYLCFFQTMLTVHKEFHGELHRACTINKPKIHEVFIKWKPKFLTYGEYCSNLPKAQEHIEELLKKNEALKAKIEVIIYWGSES